MVLERVSHGAAAQHHLRFAASRFTSAVLFFACLGSQVRVYTYGRVLKACASGPRLARVYYDVVCTMMNRI